MNSTTSDLAGHQRACPNVACGAGFAGAGCQVSSDGRFVSQTPHKRVFVRKMDRPSLRFKTKSRLRGVWAMNSTSSDLAGHQRACPNVACGAGFAGADCQVSPDDRFISQTPHKRVFVRKMDLPSLRFKTKSRLCGVWEMNSTLTDLAGHQRACPNVACGAGFAGADCQVSPDGRFISQ